MSLIKIYANFIELDIVKETLTIVKENNALIQDFKVSYSENPFLVIENENTLLALGTRDITSIKKIKVVDVFVFELGEKYFGKIQILSYEKGFRKCTLKYGTELLSIMDKKIADFMPIITVNSWYYYPKQFLDDVFPAAKFQFPKMKWLNKFGDNLQPDDEWYDYLNWINNYENASQGLGMPYNYQSYSSSGQIILHNRNVPSPQMFLLTPMFYALNSIGFSAEGSAYTDDFLKRLLIFSSENNLKLYPVFPLQNSIFLPTTPNVPYSYSKFYFNGTEYRDILAILTAGDYVIDYYFELPQSLDYYLNYLFYLVIKLPGGGWEVLFQTSTSRPHNFIKSGSLTFTAGVGNLAVHYGSYYQNLPVNYTVKIRPVGDSKNVWAFDSIIKTGKYLPDWTFGTYVNELKKLFNLKISFDNVRKKLICDFNEKEIEINRKHIIDKSLAIINNVAINFEAVHLKLINDTDLSLWIDKNGKNVFTNQTSDFVEVNESRFKLIPNNTITANLSDDLVSKDGVGLMIYEPTNKPYISKDYNGQNLTLEEPLGIYETYWKKWLKFRLNASLIEMTGYFTEIELSKISKVSRIYIDHQEYEVASLEFSETEQSNFEVLLKLQSVNF